MIADLLGIPILDLQVEVTGDVDVRGCLAINRAVKAGFRSMTCRVQLRVPPDIDPRRLAMLQKQTEQSCVNLDTLRSGVPVNLVFNVESVLSTAEKGEHSSRSRGQIGDDSFMNYELKKD
jgi:hypothetical protein